MYIPITLSCICSLLEKQIVLRFNRFMWVRKFRFLRSIFHVLSFPILCLFDGMYFEYAPQSSVWNTEMGNCSSSFHSSKKSQSCLLPLCHASMRPLSLSIAYHVQR